MRDRGYIIAFGGELKYGVDFNSRVGFIRRFGKPIIRFFRDSPHSSLKTGTLVTFEVIPDPENDHRELAIALRASWEVGMVKWFGGYDSKRERDNDFGYVDWHDPWTDISERERDDDFGYVDWDDPWTDISERERDDDSGCVDWYHPWSDTKVTRQQIDCDEQKLQPGTLVKFKVVCGALQCSGPRDCQVEGLTLLEIAAETDPDVILRCVQHPSATFWKSALPRYLNQVSHAEAVEFAIARLGADTDWEDKDFVDALPTRIVMEPKARLVRSVFDAQSRIDICLKILEGNLTQPEETAIKNELVAALSSAPDRLTRDWNTFHRLLHLGSQEARDLLPNNLHFEAVLKLRYSSENAMIDRELATELGKVLRRLNQWSAWERVPDAVLIRHGLLIGAPPGYRMKVLVRTYISGELLHQDLVIDQIVGLLLQVDASDKSFLLGQMHGRLSIEMDRRIWPHLEPKRRAEILATQLASEDSFSQESMQHLANELKSCEVEDVHRIIKALPISGVLDDNIRGFSSTMSPIDQADLWWPHLASDYNSIWPDLPTSVKLLLMYRACHNDVPLPVFVSVAWQDEKDTLVRATAIILFCRYESDPEKKSSLFRHAHDLFEQHVMDQAFASTSSIEMSQLLPKCKPGEVKYCEGRAWPTDADLKSGHVTRVWCPRAAKTCTMFKYRDFLSHYGRLYGARLYADCSQPWSDWSLLEVLEIAGVSPKLPDLSRPEEYVPKFAGWVNRLDEIRERMHCSKCGRIMVTKKAYAKMLARYNATVMQCVEGEDHDSVYFNHCWACSRIIDSRESPIQVDGYYLCIHCGSGPQNAGFSQGDKCPKCGTPSMTCGQSQCLCRNSKCGHQIWLPREKKRTGYWQVVNDYDW